MRVLLGDDQVEVHFVRTVIAAKLDSRSAQSRGKLQRSLPFDTGRRGGRFWLTGDLFLYFFENVTAEELPDAIQKAHDGQAVRASEAAQTLTLWPRGRYYLPAST